MAARIVCQLCMRCHILHALSLTPHAFLIFCVINPFRLFFEVVRKFPIAIEIGVIDTACISKISIFFAKSNLYAKRL
jgi:hypothetical protein